MLTEKEVCDRAEYCYLICLQLNWMLSNEAIQPEKYLEQIKKSSLGLAEDDFIVMTIEDGLRSGAEDCGVNNLILIYESFVHAFCEVMQIDVEDLQKSIPRDHLKKLAAEMGVELNSAT
jgi:transcriptional regulator of met regulon